MFIFGWVLIEIKGCFYRWYTNSEICEILGRFDGVLFVGDDTLAAAYAGFNILLRQDLKQGSLKEWEISSYIDTTCRCNSQFTTPACSSSRITSSEELYAEEGKKTQVPYTCSTSKFYLATLPLKKAISGSRNTDHSYKILPTHFSLLPAHLRRVPHITNSRASSLVHRRKSSP